MPIISVLIHLGYGFLRASVSYPVRIGRGKERFLQSYGAEGLVPVSSTFREGSAAYERCLGCGLCELALSQPLGLADFTCSSWRSPETWDGLTPLLDELTSMDLNRAEAICPAAVPIRSLVVELRSMLQHWNERRGSDLRAETSEVIHSTIEERSTTEP